MAGKQEYKVIFYESETGKSELLEFYKSLENKDRSKLTNWINLLKTEGANLRRPTADFLRDGIHELRVKLSGGQFRILYFFCYRNYIVLTNSFVKHTDRVPEREIEKAIKIKEEFLTRFGSKEKIDDILGE